MNSRAGTATAHPAELRLLADACVTEFPQLLRFYTDRQILTPYAGWQKIIISQEGQRGRAGRCSSLEILPVIDL